MHLSSFAGALALCTTAYAIADAPPFLLASTSAFSGVTSTKGLQSSDNVIKTAHEILNDCPTDQYLLISQPNLVADDLVTGTSRNLRQILAGPAIRGKLEVAGVFGSVKLDDLSKFIREACAKAGRSVNVEFLQLEALPITGRAVRLAQNDQELADFFEKTRVDDSYTLIFTGSPSGVPSKAINPEPINAELKRDINAQPIRRQTGAKEVDRRSVFEKYQFFNPGLFMTLFATLFLLSILYVGVRALSSLEVSYGAFDKENGPAAQKK